MAAAAAGSLSDRLNPTHPAFDAELKERWRTMGKAARAAFVEADRLALAARAAATATTPGIHPFPVDPDDHCETSTEAYADIVPVLVLLSRALGLASPAELRIWDPYYCNGAVKRHLAALGFPRVHNEPQDFYALVKAGGAPPYDVLLTNPAYSGDHVPRLLDIVGARPGAPFLLLMPNYVAGKAYTAAARARWPGTVGRMLMLHPPKRYTYWTPRGLRDPSKAQSHASAEGHRTSPFPSLWFCGLGGAAMEASVLRGLRLGAPANAPAPGSSSADAAASASAAPMPCRLRLARTLAELPKGIRPSAAAVSSDGGGGCGTEMPRPRAAAVPTGGAGGGWPPASKLATAAAAAHDAGVGVGVGTKRRRPDADASKSGGSRSGDGSAAAPAPAVSMPAPPPEALPATRDTAGRGGDVAAHADTDADAAARRAAKKARKEAKAAKAARRREDGGEGGSA